MIRILIYTLIGGVLGGMLSLLAIGFVGAYFSPFYGLVICAILGAVLANWLNHRK